MPIDPLTGQQLPYDDQTPKPMGQQTDPMWQLIGAAQQSGLLDTLMQPQNSNVMSLLSPFLSQAGAPMGPPAPTGMAPSGAAPTAAASAIDPWTGKPRPPGTIDPITEQGFPPGTPGINSPWLLGQEPYRSNDTKLPPYHYDPAYWAQRQAMTGGFRSGLKMMPGVFDLLTQATTAYPYYLPHTTPSNLQTMYQQPGAGLGGALTPEQTAQLTALAQGLGGPSGGGGGTLSALPRPPPGLRSVPGVHEPGVWQQNGSEWVWTANDQFGRPIQNASPITAALAPSTQGPAAAGAGFGAGGMGSTGGLPQSLIDQLFPGPPAAP